MIKDMTLFGKELEKINSWWITGRLELPKMVDREVFSKFVADLETNIS